MATKPKAARNVVESDKTGGAKPAPKKPAAKKAAPKKPAGAK